MISNQWIYKISFSILAFVQFLTLLAYLNVNILNVGESGSALYLLLLNFFISIVLAVVIWNRSELFIHVNTLIFFLLVSWIALRVINDTGDVNNLKQVTIATTGGMLLFFFIGAFHGISYKKIIFCQRQFSVAKLILILYLFILIGISYEFSQRMRDNLFLIEGVDGAYQRPGNFLSISFIISSYLYISIVLNSFYEKNVRISKFFWLVIYSVIAFTALITSQLFGSNSATAVTAGTYLVTLVISMVAVSGGFRSKYASDKLSLPWSKELMKSVIFLSIYGLVIFSSIVAGIIYLTGFDPSNLRLLGFGAGTNTSIESRIDILLESGVTQLSHSPIFGDYNVAFLTTGDSGRRLHSFLPFVMANLGLIGVALVFLYFASVFNQFIKESKIQNSDKVKSYQNSVIAIYGAFLIMFLFLFANIATGVSWAVLWFALGFATNPIGYK